MSGSDLAAALLRRADPETAHRAAVLALRAGLGPRGGPDDDILATSLAGLRLPNPIGLAAGFDKNAEVPDPALRAGFGFVECGTVTPLPQDGNLKPRVFRLHADRALVNRLGFNNAGIAAFAARLKGRRRCGIVGANLGANKTSEDRVADYVLGLRRLEGLCDYFTINISSPNTPGLRDLQDPGALAELLGRISEARRDPTPIFVKVAPDLRDDQIGSMVLEVRRRGLDGLIVSNTTTARPKMLRDPQAKEAGGLSGAPLFSPSTALLARFAAAAGSLPLIGVGGVSSGADALAKLKAGAAAVQLYTALVFEGPGLVGRLKRDLAAGLRREGFASASAAVGAGAA